MGLMIEDGTGSGKSAKVNDGNRLLTYSITETDFLHTNEEDEEAYVWDYPGYDYDAADTIMFLQNDSNNHLHVHHIYLYCDTATKVQLHTISGGETPTGTAVTGVNLNRTSGNAASATAKQDETGNATQGTILHSEYIAANGVLSILKEEGYEIILGKNDCIAVDLVTAGTMAYGHIVGYYHV
jgi:hypothetical protein